MSVLSQSKWTIQCLDELCNIVIGRTPSRAQLQYWGAGHYWLSISDMGSFRDIVRTKETITDAGAAICGNRLIHPGTVVLSFKLSIGKVGIVNVPMYTNEAIASLPVKDKSVLDEGYLYYALKVVNFTGRTDRAVMGQTLNTKKLQEIPIPLPPLEEQRQIAAILDKADAVHRKRRSAIALTEELLRSAFLEMFGDPVTNSKGWKLHKLVDLTSKIGSGSTPRGGEANYQLDGIPLIRSMNVYNYSFEYSGLAYIDEGQAKALNHVTVTKNDVLLNITGASVARCTIVPSSLTPARVNQHVAIIRTKLHLIQPSYLLNLINSASFKKKLLSIGRSKGATREALTKDELQNLFIPVPPIHLQEKFASITNKLMSCREQHLKMGQESGNLFNSLLQKAFQGEL